ncbi:next to BRCA1 gene 1 protein-like isoform X2 [Centruroides vittatus]|uniref:next to BRCA1 gene 1 protein-like isoform X2 n=1 Tax=Centruroides vittatus TaxID=120091 RepID=UPI00350EA1DD
MINGLINSLLITAKMKISADIIERDSRREENNVGELTITFKPKSTVYNLPFPDTASTNWRNLKLEVLRKCGLNPDSQVSISYVDEENDRIRIDSETEFLEAVRVGQKCGNKLKFLVKEVESEEKNEIQPSTSSGIFSYRELESGEFVVMDKVPCFKTHRESASDESLKQKSIHSVEVAENKSDNSIPSWLISYIAKIKDDMIKDVSDKVMDTILAMFKDMNLNSTPLLKHEECSSVTQQHDKTGRENLLHIGIICDNCEQPVRGIRYKCGTCADYDLCEKCENLPNIHNPHHIFLKIRHNMYNQFTNLSDEQLPATHLLSPHLLTSIKTLPAVVRGSLSFKHKKDKKIIKMMKKLEKYRAKEQSYNNSRISGANITWEQAPTTTKIESRSKYCHSDLNCSELRDVQFIRDETIPDGTYIICNSQFVKHWRIRNSGCKPFTSHTTLKYCWGSRDLVPYKSEVSVPHLQPGQEGTITVLFIAPSKPGNYQSHWRLYHKGHGFGHRLWCNIEVIADPNLDKIKEMNGQKTTEQIDEKNIKKQSDVQEGIAQVLTAVQESQQSGERKILSHTATPTNTPFDLSPPKSPEPSFMQTANNIQESNISSTLQIESYSTGSESDDTVSVLNAIGSESETEFVIVPKPVCYNMDIPLVPSSLQKDEETITENFTEIYSLPSTRRASTDSLPSVNNLNNGNTSSMNDAAASQETKSQDKKDNNQQSHLQNLIQLDQSVNDLETDKQASQVPDSSNLSNYINAEIEQFSHTNENISNGMTPNLRVDVVPNEERMVQVLPESLVNALTAAASVYNTARAVISGTNRNDSNQESPRPSSPPPPPPSAMNQLIEMGFSNRALNHHLLIKHNGNMEEVVGELVTIHDNNWYLHRHTAYCQFNTN